MTKHLSLRAISSLVDPVRTFISQERDPSARHQHSVAITVYEKPSVRALFSDLTDFLLSVLTRYDLPGMYEYYVFGLKNTCFTLFC